ncbi:MAG TPA: methionine adenosyltransferase [Candidatus Saccharimonadales bacterium]
MSKITQFASESVCAGHPDKIADQISDAVLDAILSQDPNSYAGVEVLVCHDHVVLAGEVRTNAKVNHAAVAREQIRRLGYTEPAWGFSDQSPVENNIHKQSSEIAVGVDNEGAGDQGMMFGYACDETPELMPLPIVLAHAFTRALDDARETGKLAYLRPDGKSQVVVNYEDDRPVGVAHVTVAVPHDEDVAIEDVRNDIFECIVTPVLSAYGHRISPEQLVVNGTGVWHKPGPSSDAGLTGRKIVVDGYGGYARVGGGAFSGKDPSKVDRSGAYAARYLAKNIVAAGLAARVEVSLAYYIGAKEPVLLTINTFGTAKETEAKLYDFARRLLVPSVKNIVGQLNLRRPIYLPTAAYGHFGRPEFPWEEIART